MTEQPAPGHWQRIEAYFHQALEAPAAARAGLIDEWFRDDPDSAAEVLALLRADAVVEQLMSTPHTAAGSLLMRDLDLEAPGQADAWIGRRLGHFTLDSLLGRGGMGVVYRGHRSAGGLTQTVAVKIIARHLRRSPALSQFLSEREVLGRLEHPHIARLIDGGIEDGTPYVVMEYVEGRPLDQVCDDPALSVRVKIELFLQLCDAVSYVHGHLILHRDLKPANVLVTHDGNVKLLDFGTLKRVDVEAADSLMTRAGMRSVTVRYASPEQLAGHRVSTATDVFSLGVILRRVLAGELPQVSDDPALLAPNVSLAGIDATRQIRRDLEVIVAKALRHAPADRFSSVDALAQDLRNVLSNRPVTARAGDLRYRAAMFIVRHRAALLGLAAVGLTVLAGLVAVVHEGAIASAETQRAQAGVEDERKLAHLLLFDYFEQLKIIPGSIDAQRRAVSHALAYVDSLALESGALMLDRIDAYTKMGNLLGNPYEENIGDGERARVALQKAVALSRQWLIDRPDDLRALQSSASAEQSLGRVYFGSGDPARALEYLKPAADISRRIASLPGVDVASIAQAASVVDSLGDVYGQEGAVTLDDPGAAIAAYSEAQAIDQRGLKIDGTCARCRRGIALEYWKIGMLTEALDEDQAVAAYRQGLEVITHFSAEEQLTTRVRRLDTVIRQRLGTLLMAAGRAAEGIRLLSEVQLRFRAAVDADPTDTRARFDLAALDQSLAVGYEQLRRPAQALAADREFADNMTVLVAQDKQNTMWRVHRGESLVKLGLAELAANDLLRGREALDEGVALLVQLAQAKDADGYVLELAATALLDTRRDAPLALALAQRGVLKEPASVAALITLARAQRAAGQTAESHDSARRALDLLGGHPKSIGNAEQTAQARALT